MFSCRLTIILAKMEGLTASKPSIPSEIYKIENVVNTCCPQETHRYTNPSNPNIAEMPLIAERPHNTYGSAIFIRDDLKVENCMKEYK